ncbi:MAG: hypothetical protein IKC59_03575, partial [Clostridia bacterium]|nr:hypothetical protein [Clostridia bacterium]
MILPDTLSAEAKAARFARICEDAMRERRSQGEQGIGTLAEKWQHQIIKRYLSEDPSDHEIPVSIERRFVSDVRVGMDAYEVQTGSFAPMAKKIAYYLESTDLTVTVVHPIAKSRWVSWVDFDTAEISPRKRSPRHGDAKELLAELYPLLPLLPHPRLQFRVLLLEVHDFKLLSNRKKDRRRGAVRYERIPLSLMEDISFSSPEDFARFLPDSLDSPFTVKQFSEATKIRGRDAYSAVRVLTA